MYRTSFVASIIYSCLYFSLAVPGAAAQYAVAPATVEYQEGIARPIAEAKTTYPAARARYLAGLPSKSKFYVAYRLTDKYGYWAFAIVRVSRIDVVKGEISGIITNDLEKISDEYERNDRVRFPERELIDWKIVAEGDKVEGDYIAKYLATIGGHPDLHALLEDRREIELRVIGQSPAVIKAVGGVLVGLIGDTSIPVECVSGRSVVKEWPALVSYFKGSKPETVMARLKRRKAESAGKLKVDIGGLTYSVGRSEVYVVTAHVYYKHNGSPIPIETTQCFNFCFEGGALKSVDWGLTTSRFVGLKAGANKPPSGGTPAAGAPVAHPPGIAGR